MLSVKHLHKEHKTETAENTRIQIHTMRVTILEL